MRRKLEKSLDSENLLLERLGACLCFSQRGLSANEATTTSYPKSFRLLTVQSQIARAFTSNHNYSRTLTTSHNQEHSRARTTTHELSRAVTSGHEHSRALTSNHEHSQAFTNTHKYSQPFTMTHEDLRTIHQVTSCHLHVAIPLSKPERPDCGCKRLLHAQPTS